MRVGQVVEKKKRALIFTAGSNVDWSGHYGKHRGKFLKKFRTELPRDPTIPALGIYPKRSKARIHRDLRAPVFIAAFFARPRQAMQPARVPSERGLGGKMDICKRDTPHP